MNTLPSHYLNRCHQLSHSPNLRHSKGTLKSQGETTLHYQSWVPVSHPRAVVVIIHGLGGHTGLFGNLIDHFVHQDFAVYSLDLRGHGCSSGQRGFINTWAEYRADLAVLLELVTVQLAKQPYFVVGHSLGAVVALDYVLHFPNAVQGVIAISPPMGKVEISRFRLALGTLFSLIYPRFSLSSGVSSSMGSRDPDVNLAYTQDSLRHKRGTARLATEFFKTVAWIKQHSAELKTPLLILHGGGDRFVPPEGSRVFFEQLPLADKERIEYPGAYHELQNELNYQEILHDMTNWIERHLAEAPPLSSNSSNEHI
ncbi:MAG: alpha/beta hydrolase [Oscillatoriales cyanobacterium C42_A2020_001]|nr:alpha/beta hydrolase [Leptolyngbyaceae cyanobacterium C42_A2020_001]